ncbi:hypothetical protein VM1G_03299 [Cytospora mali]|uniref:BTB domain-containing protein n=1 Tax=Cytospora mali TaxID=578113 RepID=A0A194VSZ3_CYTMA|nr:hypothetical protein VM1G_03299 [Valsa mali]
MDNMDNMDNMDDSDNQRRPSPKKRKVDDPNSAEDQPPSLYNLLTIREDKQSDSQPAELETASDSIFNSPIVTIALGPKKVRFLVHEKVLEQAGQLLNKTVSDGFQEAHNKYIELPDDDADVFEVLVKWMYGSCVNPSANKDLLCESYARKLIRLYILAYKYMVDGLQDNIMSEMYDQMEVYRWEHMHIDEDILIQLWACTPSSHMHKLLARWFIYDAINPSMSDMPEVELNSLPERFVRLTIREMFNIKLNATVQAIEVCGEKRGYFLHEDQEVGD